MSNTKLDKVVFNHHIANMDFTLFIFLFCLIGCVAGFLGGLFGVGGGIFVVPALLVTLRAQGFHRLELMEVAIGTSLASMFFNSLNSVLCHQKHSNISWQTAKDGIFPLILGCFIGSTIGHILPTDTLTFIFGIFAFLLGLSFLFQKKRSIPRVFVPSPLFFKTAIAFIAILSNVLGVGGGVMTVPFLSRFYMPIKNAIGTSSVLTLLITFFGASSYFLFGVFSNHLQEPYTIGFIYLPAFIAISFSSFFTARYGSFLSIQLSKERIERYFGYFLVVIAVLMTCMPEILKHFN